MAEHWSWLTGTEAGEYTYSPPTRPSRPPHRPLVKLATSAHLHTIARWICHGAHYWVAVRMLWFFVFVAVALGSVRGDAEVMSHVTAHFGKALEECREESGLSSELMEEFHHFWREDFEVVHRELGCAIICMSNKFSLMHDDAKMHHANMHDYIKSFPKGEILSAKMVELIHNCEKNFDDLPDECDRVVKTAACFKVNARKEGIAPEMTMMEAVLEKY